MSSAVLASPVSITAPRGSPLSACWTKGIVARGPVAYPAPFIKGRTFLKEFLTDSGISILASERFKIPAKLLSWKPLGSPNF